MSIAVEHSSRDHSSNAILLAMLVLSILGHLATLYFLPAQRPLSLALNKPVELEIIEIKPPPPPPPPPEEPEPPKARPPPVRVETPKPPPVEAPPPPNEETKEPPKPVPLVVGLTLSSTSTSGGFAAPVGNTLYGKTADKAVDAQEVKPYTAPRYVPPGGADTEPQVMSDYKIPYPDDARRNEIEGQVRLKVRVDERGNVTQVSLVSGPGYGLNEAALAALKRFRFKPAIKGGEAVGTTIIYTYTFLLD